MTFDLTSRGSLTELTLNLSASVGVSGVWDAATLSQRWMFI